MSPETQPKSSETQPKAPETRPKAPETRATTPDYSTKQTQILAASCAAASNVLVAIARLKECNLLLTQSGGNFDDAQFTSGQFVYLDSYHANVLLQQAAPDIDAFLDQNIGGDTGLPTYRELFQMCVTGPY
jgi:hypothetical protein